MTSIEDLVARYRSELRRLVAKRRKLTAVIDAKREILRDLLATLEEGGRRRGSSAPRRGKITQANAVRTVLGEPGAEMTAGEVYAAALAAGAGGSERSLRNVLSRMVKDGELAVERGVYPYRYRAVTGGTASG
jgi:DNA-binding transcriptional regulator PaaX